MIFIDNLQIQLTDLISQGRGITVSKDGYTCSLQNDMSRFISEAVTAGHTTTGHLFSHNFNNINDPSCECGSRSQSTKHLLFNCPLLTETRNQFFNDPGLLPHLISANFFALCVDERLQLLLYGHNSLGIEINQTILETTAKFFTSITTQLNN
jgi:hypothetical protein